MGSDFALSCPALIEFRVCCGWTGYLREGMWMPIEFQSVVHVDSELTDMRLAYERGGPLPDGDTQVVNLTGKPERVV